MMKKFWLFLFSSLIALGIAYYSKKTPSYLSMGKPSWKTFVKKSSKVAHHPSTGAELEQARIPGITRDIAQEKNQSSTNSFTLPKDRTYLIRENRLLMGDIEHGNYQDENVELEMVNKINPDWKTILGNDLLRFHDDDTKVMVKEEFPIIRVQNGKGIYLEQVMVTYVFKNGNFSSFHALVDSDSGFVIDTWDKTVNEHVKSKRAEITLPENNTSGIITR